MILSTLERQGSYSAVEYLHRARCADPGHSSYFAGDDPLALAKAHARRIKHVHLKDIRDSVWKEVQKTHGSFFDGVMAGFFTVPGDGVIDFRPTLQVLADSG